MERQNSAALQDDVLEHAVGQLSLVSAAMKMLLESCEAALLEAAEASDPGPTPVKTPQMRHGSGRSHTPIRNRLRPARGR